MTDSVLFFKAALLFVVGITIRTGPVSFVLLDLVDSAKAVMLCCSTFKPAFHFIKAMAIRTGPASFVLLDPNQLFIL